MAVNPDVAALLRTLRERPEQAAALRELLLGDDLDVRGALAKLADAQRRTEERVEQLAGRFAQLAERVDQLADAQRRTEERVEQLTEQVTDLTRQVGRLTTRVGELADRVAWLQGDAWERRYRERGHTYLRDIALRLRPLDARAVDDLLDPAVEEGRLSPEDAGRVRLADGLFQGRRRTDGAPVHLVVEVSLGVGLDDVRRARERADALTAAGIPSIPVVAGEWVVGDAGRAARATGVWQVTNGRAEPPDDDREPDARTA